MSRKSGKAKKNIIAEYVEVEQISAGALIDKIVAVEEDVVKMSLQISTLIESSEQIKKNCSYFNDFWSRCMLDTWSQ